MAKPLPARAPAPRVVHYLDPARPQLLQPVPTGAQLAARQREYRLAYERWAVRQAEIAAHDRKVRRFWLGFGAVVGNGLLAVLGLLGWLVYHAITTASAGLLVAPLVVIAAVGLVVGGRRCVTTIQHWH
jgi:hypothetical protein